MTKAYRRQRPPHQHRWDTNPDPGGRTNRLLKEEREREAAEGLEELDLSRATFAEQFRGAVQLGPIFPLSPEHYDDWPRDEAEP